MDFQHTEEGEGAEEERKMEGNAGMLQEVKDKEEVRLHQEERQGVGSEGLDQGDRCRQGSEGLVIQKPKGRRSRKKKQPQQEEENHVEGRKRPHQEGEEGEEEEEKESKSKRRHSKEEEEKRQKE